MTLEEREELIYRQCQDIIAPFIVELEVRDKEYLDIIRKSKPTNDALLDEVCDEAVKLAREIKDLKISSGLDAKEKELKVLETSIKEVMMGSNLDNCGSYTLVRKEDLEFNEAKFAQ